MLRKSLILIIITITFTFPIHSAFAQACEALAEASRAQAEAWDKAAFSLIAWNQAATDSIPGAGILRDRALKSQELAQKVERGCHKWPVDIVRQFASRARSMAEIAREHIAETEKEMRLGKANAEGRYATLWERAEEPYAVERTAWIKAAKSWETAAEEIGKIDLQKKISP